MDLADKNTYKAQFKRGLDSFVLDLVDYVSTDKGDWSIKGFIDVDKNIFTISSDTKIISKILEIHIFPKIFQFAETIGYEIILADKQNWYPDLTLVNKANDEVKFALDIKTTFRRNAETAGFALGSHGSYFKERDKNKNIQYPYNQYLGHYCLGIIYTRTVFEDNLSDSKIYQVQELQEVHDIPIVKVGEREVTSIENLKSIVSVIKDFDFFACEKWKIASDKQGSGNTANIGSIVNIADLKSGNGTFSQLGEKLFDEYWISYGTTIMKNDIVTKITSLRDFLEFTGRQELIVNIVSKKSKK